MADGQDWCMQSDDSGLSLDMSYLDSELDFFLRYLFEHNPFTALQ